MDEDTIANTDEEEIDDFETDEFGRRLWPERAQWGDGFDADGLDRPRADAVRRQVVAARAGRPPSPDVEDVYVDEPDTWP